MRDETAQKLRDLATALRTTRGQPLGGYVLFIGGGASNIAGHSAVDELRLQVLSGAGFTTEQVSSMRLGQQIDQFDQTWSNWGYGSKTAAWQELHKKLRPTKGHTALALLLKENYFPLVLTTIIDQLMESVFISSTIGEGQPLRPWSILVNGRDTQDNIQDAIQDIVSDTTIFLKLCGDIRSGTFAVTEDEVKTMAQQIRGVLGNVLRRRALIIVGLTTLDDVMIPSFPDVVDKVIFIGTERPSENSKFENHRWNQRPIYIIDSDLNFDLIFQTIAERLNILQEVEQSTGRTLDEEDLERIDKATQVSQTPEEALVQIIKTEQQRVGSNTSPIFSLIETTVFTVKVEANRQVSFEVMGGGLNYTSEGSKEWNVNVADLNQFIQDMGHDIATYHRLEDQRGRDSWRRHAKREGERLYNDLIQAYPDLDRKLELARQTAFEDDPQNLTLVFSGPREYLGMPYELLHDQKAPLVVSHPLCRKVNGVSIRHSEPFDTFVQALRQKKQHLRVLLIASDTGSLTVNQEVAQLKDLIERKTQEVKLQVDVEVLSTEKASLTEVQKILTNCTYHIVHYAGHGRFDENTGENSGLYLWQPGVQGKKTAILSARELASKLTSSETRLFYLNACVGAWTGGNQLLRDNDYLGTMDALVQAGIPYVLGFRWYVTDSASRRFAELFYDHLFTRPLVPERAVWHARKQLYEHKGTDETWTSPILVAQNPYR